MPKVGGVLDRVCDVTTTTTIDRLGQPQQSDILSRKAGTLSRKMREVFTTSGYALLDDGAKLSTANGLVSLEQLSRDLLAGEKVLVESLQSKFDAREFRDDDIVASPGSIQVDKALVRKLLANIELTFNSAKEATIPRICFPYTPAILGRLRKKSPALCCDVDNKIYPCEIFVRTNEKGENQLLSITNIFEDKTTIVEIPAGCKAVVVDGLVCS